MRHDPTRAGNAFFRAGDADGAIPKYEKALELNPRKGTAHQKLGFLLLNVKRRRQEAMPHLEEAVRLEPGNPFARYDLGMAYSSAGDMAKALPHLEEAVRLLPNGYDPQYNLVDMSFHLAVAYYAREHYSKAVSALDLVLQRSPNHPRANYLMAMAKAALGETEVTKPYYEAAVRAQPDMARLPDYYDLLSRNYVERRQFAEGLKAAEQAHRLAVEAGRPDQAAKLLERTRTCRNSM
jgi:tetratricopeptide (TPR) repeat protein